MAGTHQDWKDWSEPDEAPGGDDGEKRAAEVDPRLAAGVEHLQRAAKEAIAATRALLDVADELVDDPRAVRGLLGALSTVAGAATDLAGRARPGSRPDGPDDDPGVQRIPVS